MDARQAKKGGATEKPAGDWLFSVNVPEKVKSKSRKN